MQNLKNIDIKNLINNIKLWGENAGLSVRITQPRLLDKQQIKNFEEWLKNENYGTMQFMQKHHELRCDPHALMPEVQSIICCRLNYTPQESHNAMIVSYALCRDYHKIMRQRLDRLAQQIVTFINDKNFRYRIFCDSAPVLEKALAVQAGLGWIGKNTLLLNEQSGSYSFLGEIYTNLKLADKITDAAAPHRTTKRCGSCTKCLDICPTKALYSPYSLDARRCIAYLTIEHNGSIPHELRPLIGTRIFGCDLCQKCCPWNQLPSAAQGNDIFIPLPSWRGMDLSLAQLFLWDEANYLRNSEGSPLRRLGYERWLRNIAVALGNSERTEENLVALKIGCEHNSELVREHAKWASEMLSAL